MQRLSDLYEKHGLNGPSDEFWADVSDIENRLVKALKQRPLTNIQIADACLLAERSFNNACCREKKRDEQARAAATSSRA